jgi:hypothetical protein
MEIKVTPERLEPIMPKATMYQGEERLAKKKELLSDLRPVIQEMPMRNKK